MIITKSGLYEVAELYEIISTSSTDDTIQEWEFTVSFINLDTNQAENGGKTLEAEIILSREEKVTLANYIIDNVYVEDGVNNLYYHDGQGDYINAELEAGDNSYRYSGGYEVADAYKDTYTTVDELLDALTYSAYFIEGQAVNVETEEGVRNAYLLSAQAYCEINECDAESIISTIFDGTNEVTEEDLQGFYTYFGQKQQDNEYQFSCWGYVGDSSVYVPNYIYYEDYTVANTNYKYDLIRYLINDGYLKEPNNYVCFGSDEETCSNDNLYRIIGVFDNNVKLIKYDYATEEMLGTEGQFDIGDSYAYYNPSQWENYRGNFQDNFPLYLRNENYIAIYEETGYYNIWSLTDLNTINLNTNYINYLNNKNGKWVNMIADTNWIVRAKVYNYILYAETIKEAFDVEMSTSTQYGDYEREDYETYYNAKIGLMYLSDYLYSASPNYWTTKISDSQPNDDYRLSIDENWLFMGYLYDFTITTSYDGYRYNTFSIYNNGQITLVPGLYYSGIRPTFYLKPSVLITSGDGTINNPYRIEI